MKQHDKLLTIRISSALLEALKALNIDLSKDIRGYLESKIKKTKKAS
jgi:post-segregation antitoxin (ccd killing protein)